MSGQVWHYLLMIVIGVPNFFAYWRSYSAEKAYMRRYCATYRVPEPSISQWFFGNPFEAWDRLSIRQSVPELERMRRVAKSWLIVSLIAPMLTVIVMLTVITFAFPKPLTP